MFNGCAQVAAEIFYIFAIKNKYFVGHVSIQEDDAIFGAFDGFNNLVLHLDVMSPAILPIKRARYLG